MTFATDLRSTLRSIRSIPGQLGLRPYSVSVCVRFNSGRYGLEGTTTDVVSQITEAGGHPPKIRFLNDEQINISALPKGSVTVGPITPESLSGGLTIADLTGASSEPGELVHFILVGPEMPEGGRYRLVGSQSDRALHYMLTLAPLASDE